VPSGTELCCYILGRQRKMCAYQLIILWYHAIGLKYCVNLPMCINVCVSCNVTAIRVPIFKCIATKYNLTEDDSPCYKYIPTRVLQSYTYILYGNRSILTDRTIARNRSDVTFTDKVSDTVLLIDIAIPETHNLQKTWIQKCNKHRDIPRVMYYILL
jgi:hypothetical protein